MSIGELIRSYRRFHGIEQDDAGAQASVSRKLIWQVETGRRTSVDPSLGRLAAACRVPRAELERAVEGDAVCLAAYDVLVLT